MEVDGRDWSSLPQIAIFNIATRLNAIQSTAIRGVCKSWRSVCIQNKAAISAKHPPLVLHFARITNTNHDSPVCLLYSFPDNAGYVSPPLPPDFHDALSIFYTYSHGYLITITRDDRSALRCYSPFTRHYFVLPFPSWWTFHHVNCAAFSDTPSSGSCLVVVFTSEHMICCRLRAGELDPSWSVVRNNELFGVNQRVVRQALWFKGLLYCIGGQKVYAIELDQYTLPSLKFDTDIFNPSSLTSASVSCLLANEEEIMAVNVLGEKNEVYRLQNPELGNWELVDNVGGRTLFATRCNGFLPSVAGLLGYEQDWDDRIFFADPFCNLSINRATRVIWYRVNHQFPFAYYQYFDGLFTNAWVPPSLIC